MTLTLSERKSEEASKAHKGSSVYLALMNGLNEMERQGVDRVILTMYESEPSLNARGRWLTLGKDTNYYPFNMLDEAEQGMIRNGKHYTIVALVRDNVGDLVRYEDKGVEKYLRTHIVPMLPKLKPESELNYVIEGGIYTGENLKQFAESATRDGWTPELIEQRIRDGIQEYHEVTKRLMEKAGVYDALERMEKRHFTLFEQVMGRKV